MSSSTISYPPSTGSGSSPLTTKGDIYTFTTVNARLPVGTDGFALVADSTQVTGLKWASVGGTGNMNTSTYDPVGIAEQLVGINATQTITNKTLTQPKIAQIKDVNGNTILDLSPTAGAVNNVLITNQSTGSYPSFTANGTDTNIGFDIAPKGNAPVRIYTTTGNTPTLSAAGADTNLNLNLTSKGTGIVTVNGVQVTDLSSVQVLTNKDLSSVTNTFPTFNQNTTGSAATLTTARTIGIATGDITSTGSTFNGSANNTNTYTLATVNSNVGSFTNASITVNAKGLITAASSGGTSTATAVTETVTQTAHGFSVGQIVGQNGGNYVLSEANNATNATVVGIVSTVVNANSFVLTTEGLVTGLSGIGVSSQYFLSAGTAGATTTTEPSTVGQVSKPVYVGITTTSVLFHNYRGIVIASAGTGTVTSVTSADANATVATTTTTPVITIVSAPKLLTARAIAIGGTTGLTATGINFDGTAAITPLLTGTLVVANGGTGVTTSTGSGANVLGTSPTIATPSITYTNNSIPATALATTAISLGRTEITTAFSTTSTTVVQVTGLTRAVTIPAGGRDVEVTVVLPDVQGSTIINVTIGLWDGTVGTGTLLNQIVWTSGGTNYHTPITFGKVITALAAGSKTYNVGMLVGSGTGTINAAATTPPYLQVKVI